jgi:hypothetical protein
MDNWQTHQKIFAGKSKGCHFYALQLYQDKVK